MEFRKEKDTKKILEFIELSENYKIELRRYREPVLVWAVEDGTAYYSIWENEMLEKFGLENVDGWDYEEDLLFCPDWMADEEDKLDDDEDDDEDFDWDFKETPAKKTKTTSTKATTQKAASSKTTTKKATLTKSSPKKK